MTSTSKQPIYRIITDRIASDILSGTLGPGDSVPSIRGLRKEYGVSQVTAMRVFQELSKSGHVMKREGSGYVVRDPEKREHSRNSGYVLCCVYPMRTINNRDNWGNRIHCGIMEECLNRRLGLMYPRSLAVFKQGRVMRGGEEELVAEILETADEVAGLLLDWRIDDGLVAEKLLGKVGTLPMVMVGRETELPIASVAPPNRSGTQAAADFALKAGYDEFIVCEHTNCWQTGNRGSVFRDTLLGTGMDRKRVLMIEDCFSSVEHNSYMLDLILKKIERTRSGKLLIFTATDSLGRVVTDRLIEEGVGVGETVGLLSFGGKEWAVSHSPKVASVAVDVEEIGRKAVEALTEEGIPTHSVVEFKLEFNETLVGFGLNKRE